MIGKNGLVKETNPRSISVDFARLLCSFIVVGIHTAIFHEFSEPLSLIMTQQIGRIAVPFFFVLSGFFYNNAVNQCLKSENISNIYIYILKIIRLYTVWSLLALLQTLAFCLANQTSFVNQIPRIILSFFITGTTDPLWFFPALIYSEIIIYLVKRRSKFPYLCAVALVLYIICCLLQSYAFLFHDDSIVNTIRVLRWFNPIKRIVLIGLPFTVLGCVASEYQLHNKFKDRSTLVFAVSFVVLLIESFLVWKVTNSLEISQTFILPVFILTTLLFLLNHPMSNTSISGRQLRNIATFVYLFHPFLIDAIIFANGHFFRKPISETPRFFLVLFFSLLFGIIASKDKRFVRYCL